MMGRGQRVLIFLVKLTLVFAKDPNGNLPLCPTNVQYFPQDLPMHCRMPRSADFNIPDIGKIPGLPTFPPPFYQSPPPDKQPPPIPFPVPPGFPPFPPPFPGPLPPGMPGPMPPGMPGPMPIGMPIGMPAPSHKLPVIVMPFYSPDPLYKQEEKQRPDRKRKRRLEIHTRRPPHYSDSSDTDSDTSSDTSSSSSSDNDDGTGYWKGHEKNFRRSRRQRRKRRHHNKKELLTPIIQYVTKDGYVIFEKEISKGEAKDWLNVKKQEERDENKVEYSEAEEINNEAANNKDEDINLLKNKVEAELAEVKAKKALGKKRRHKASQASKVAST